MTILSKYNQLHTYLLDAADDLRAKCAANDSDRGRIHIAVTFAPYDGLEIKYTVSERYDSGPTGNELAAVMEEFFRRKGWELQNNTRLLSPPADDNNF